ncbi:MAG TPA: type IV pilus modification protein PilV [Ramlibacter sp.]|uniref:type IV pilus modification protein PilV n=1 Tax=Ramlibacter sp. TaxID=1917967 RepID=UPI002ED53F03
MSRKTPRRVSSQLGASLIEVLVSMVILMIGLLGLIGVMIESQRAQLESYQRAQALLLVQDMAARIGGNRMASECYSQAAGVMFGTDHGTVAAVTPGCASGTVAEKAAREDRATRDLREWQDLLLGSTEQIGGSNVGSMLGARGCIAKDATTGVFMVSVAWQGGQTLGGPPAAITCGSGQYGDETKRRAVGLTLIPPVSS